MLERGLEACQTRRGQYRKFLEPIRFQNRGIDVLKFCRGSRPEKRSRLVEMENQSKRNTATKARETQH